MKKNEIGSIAVLSLWVLLFLTVLMFGAGSGVRSRLLTIKKSEMSKTLYNAARSGELYVIYNITTYFKNKQNSS